MKLLIILLLTTFPLFSLSPVFPDVVESGPIIHTVSGSGYEIDFDSNGEVDVTFGWGYYMSGSIPGDSNSHAEGGHCNVILGNRVFAKASQSSITPNPALPTRDNWDSTEWIHKTLDAGGYNISGINPSIHSGWENNFSSVDITYLHFLIYSNGQYYNAWVKMLYADDFSTSEDGPIILSYGYQTNPVAFTPTIPTPSISNQFLNNNVNYIHVSDMVAGYVYRVEKNSDFSSPNGWTLVQQFTATSSTKSVSDILSNTTTSRFYRVSRN